jgi:hypothetical protein
MDRNTRQSPRQRGYGSTSSLRNDSLKHTRKHEKGREEPNQEAKHTGSGGPSGQEGRTVRPGGADRPHWPRGPSGLMPRTVRANPADCPALHREPSDKTHRTNRSDLRKTDRPQRPGGPSAWVADHPLLKLGLSANQLQQKPKAKPDRKQRRARTRRTRDEHATRGPSATSPRTVRAARTEQKTARPRRSTRPNHHRISQTVEAMKTRVWGLEKRHTRML